MGTAIRQGMELTRNSSGNAGPQWSRLAEPLWADPGLKSRTGTWCAGADIHLKKKKKGGGEGRGEKKKKTKREWSLIH